MSMAQQFVLITPKLQHQRCNIFPSSSEFSSSTWCSSRDHRRLTNRLTKSSTLKACLKENKRYSEEKDRDYRPLAYFSPSIWKNTFASIPFRQLEFDYCDKKVKELKEKVKEMLIASTKDLAENVILIDSLCRLGVSYHFENEIEQQLNQIFESHGTLGDDHDYDLYTTAILFRVLRQHGFKMPCGVFKKFRDETGMFKESLISDVKGMLSLYEATYLSMHGEDILDEAVMFTKAHLTVLAANSSQHLSLHIIESLEQPLHRDIPRINARKYLSFYEHEESKNGTLLLFAKLDYNRVQFLHQKELSYLTSWWKDLNFASTYSYARDRIVEIYIWSVAQYYEPCYSRARLIFTKIFKALTVIDDTYDAYGTLDELKSFTEAVERWDVNALNQLPDYLKRLYSYLLNLFEELNNEMSQEGRSYSLSFTKDAMKEIVRGYFVEAEWFRKNFVPSFDERMSNALITGGCILVPATGFMGMGEIAGIDSFEWLQSKPKVMVSSFALSRLIADMVSHEDEQERGHVASIVESCMKEYGTSREETAEKFKKMISSYWKDINEECITPTRVPLRLINVVINVARLVEVFYKKADGVTKPEYLKDYVTKLFIDPIKVQMST